MTLAKSIARDGEGATKLLEVIVTGAKDEKQAQCIAKSIIVSPLVKTAIYGESPNWGRIIARIGNEDVSEDMLASCVISVQEIILFKDGKPQDDAHDLKKQLSSDQVTIQVDFNAGQGNAKAFGCDLTEKYVKINAEYVS